MLQVSLFGEFSLKVDGQLLPPVPEELVCLTAFLLLSRRAGSLPLVHIAAELEIEIADLNQRLAIMKLVLPEPAWFFEVKSAEIRFHQDAPVDSDLDQFLNYLKRAADAQKTQRDNDAAAALVAAVGAYTGDLLPNCISPWIEEQRHLLRQAYLNALTDLVRLLEKKNQLNAVRTYARLLLRSDPLNQVAYRTLMRQQLAQQNRLGALHLYHTCAAHLQDQPQSLPEAKTQAIYQQILYRNGEPVHEASYYRQFQAPDRRIAEGVLEPAPAPLPLIGRKKEIEQLTSAALLATKGQTTFALISGPAGIGKTRLATEIINWASQAGISHARAACYATLQTAAYDPIAQWLNDPTLRASITTLKRDYLKDIARVATWLRAELPSLPKTGPLQDASQKQRLFNALVYLIACQPKPLLLTIDDLQWCDSVTLEWLVYIFSKHTHLRLIILSTMRPEELDRPEYLNQLRSAAYQYAHLESIRLEGLSSKETALLGAAVAGHPLTPEQSRRLYYETEGNPLFIIEMQSYIKDGNAQSNSEKVTVIPAGIRALIDQRLERLSPLARQAIQSAAVLGRQFTSVGLLQVSGLSEDELVHCLDELWRRQVIRVQGANVYDFSHDKIRQAVLAMIPSEQRKDMHIKIAEQLQAELAHSLNIPGDAISAQTTLQIAQHYAQAGETEAAARFYLQAAQAAQAIYANTQALAHYQSALDLLHRASLSPPNEPGSGRLTLLKNSLLEEFGDLQSLIGNNTQARLAFQQALAGCRPDFLVDRARLLRKIARTYEFQGQHPAALQCLQKAHDILGDNYSELDQPSRHEWIDIQLDRLLVYYWLGQTDDMFMTARRIRPIIEMHGSAANRARLLDALSAGELRHSRYRISDQFLDDRKKVLATYQKLGATPQIAWTQYNLGFSLLWRSVNEAPPSRQDMLTKSPILADLESPRLAFENESEQELLAALELAENIGDQVLQVRCLANLMILYRRRSDFPRIQEIIDRLARLTNRSQLQEYEAAAIACQAWLALRQGAPVQALSQARQALEIWTSHPTAYPFHWLALFPQAAAALSLGEYDTARQALDRLQNPSQMALPAPVEQAIRQVLASPDDIETLEIAVETGRDWDFW